MPTTIIVCASVLSASFIVGMAAIAAALGNSKVCSAAIETMSIRPEERFAQLGPALISVGIIESIPIIGVVLALVLLFANPFLQ